MFCTAVFLRHVKSMMGNSPLRWEKRTFLQFNITYFEWCPLNSHWILYSVIISLHHKKKHFCKGLSKCTSFAVHVLQTRPRSRRVYILADGLSFCLPFQTFENILIKHVPTGHSVECCWDLKDFFCACNVLIIINMIGYWKYVFFLPGTNV